jgi:hypothetical protein
VKQQRPLRRALRSGFRPTLACRQDAPRTGADQESRDFLDGLLSGRQPHARERIRHERFEPLQRERQVRSALRASDGVDLVDDDGTRGRKHFPARRGAEQDVERLGRRHHDVRRRARHSHPLGCGRIARSHPRADLHVRQPERTQLRADARERRREVPIDVVGERLQRRDVDDLRLILQLACEPFANEAVDGREKGGEGLAGPGGCSNEHVPVGANRRPGLRLCRRGRFKGAAKPVRDGGMKRGEYVHGQRS